MRRRGWDPRRWSFLQVALAVVLIVAAAGLVRLVTRDRSCFPGPPQAAPASVAAGERVVVTATAFTCARRFHRGAGYGLELVPAAGAADAGDGVVFGSIFPVDRDGTFRARVRIPDDTAPGRAVIRFTGFDVDELYDEVCSERHCGTYGAALVIR